MLIVDLGREVRLEALAIALGVEEIEYGVFSGLIYPLPLYEVTLLISASGKIIIGGTTGRDRSKSTIQHLREEFSLLDSTRLRWRNENCENDTHLRNCTGHANPPESAQVVEDL